MLLVIPIVLITFVLGWNLLRSFKPKDYRKCINWYHGFVWHFFNPRTKQGFELVKDMKDLVRGTIYSNLNEVIAAYKFLKETPGVKVIAIKEKISSLNNITVNFIYQNRFVGEMQFHYLEQTDQQKEKYYANHILYELERSQEKIEMLAAINK